MLTNSQVAIQNMLSTYPCLKSWLLFIKNAIPNSMNYDPTSCAQMALISKSGMKTLDYIAVNADDADVVRVSKMLAEFHDYAWQMWTSYTAQSRRSTGKASLKLTPASIQGLTTFDNWDIVLNPDPTFSPPVLFESVLKGVIL